MLQHIGYGTFVFFGVRLKISSRNDDAEYTADFLIPRGLLYSVPGTLHPHFLDFHH